HGEQQDQVADVQAGSGGVKASVQRDLAGVECLAQLVQLGRHGDQAPPRQVVDDVGHRCILPSTALAYLLEFPRSLGTYGRYAETAGSPITQKRHGASAPSRTPTLGPLLMASDGRPSNPAGPNTRSELAGSQASAPFCARPMASAWQSLAGPLASS